MMSPPVRPPSPVDPLTAHKHSRTPDYQCLTFQGHVTSSLTWPFHSPHAISYWWSIGTKLLISNGFRDVQWRMWRNGWHELKRPLNKGQGHSFWYQSIPHIRLPIGCQDAPFSRNTYHRQTTDGRNIVAKARPLKRSTKNTKKTD